jgi:ribosome maturation factor RimP
MGVSPIFYLRKRKPPKVTTKLAVLTALIEPVVVGLGLELWGIEYHSSGGRRSILRIYIEAEGGVTLESCQKVSRQVSGILDVEDPIQGEYTLEVSSPGMDRPLFKVAHYLQYVGYKVKIRLRVPFEGQRNLTGRIAAVEDGEEVVIQVDEPEQEYVLPIESIDKAHIVPEFT